MKCTSLGSITIAALLVVPAAFAQQKMDDMTKGKDTGSMPAGAQSTHRAAGTVKKVDPRAGTVMLAHGPIKSLNWPSMTMRFKVADPKLFNKLAEGKQVEVEFHQSGKDYVVTSVK